MPAINGLSVKREIIEYKVKDSERIPLLSGFVRSCMSLHRDANKELALELDCQVEFVREFIAANMLKACKVSPRAGEGSALHYGDCKKLLVTLGIIKSEDGFEMCGIPEQFEKYDSAYTRGAFLACGSCSIPDITVTDDAAGYHIEFAFFDELPADALSELLKKRDITLHRMERSNRCVLYAKDGDSISNALALMHAEKTFLLLQDAIVRKSFKADINRKNNFDLANITRSANAAVDVVKAIELIEKTVGVDTLDPKLVEAANARANSPDAPLSELAFELGISKSGLKHRFDRLTEIARTLAKNNKQ